MLQWSDSLVTGISEIDAQHRELFNRINRLFEACSKQRGKEEVSAVARFIDDYVRTHFAAEERAMSQHAYPKLRDHKAMHDKFIEDFTALQDTIRHDMIKQGTTGLSGIIGTNRLLSDWWINHINTVDKQFACFLLGMKTSAPGRPAQGR